MATYIQKSPLIRVYNKLKNNPNKIFLRYELFKSDKINFKRKHKINELNTRDLLLKLDIMEEVPTYYFNGKGGRRLVRGFRLKKRSMIDLEVINLENKKDGVINEGD